MRLRRTLVLAGVLAVSATWVTAAPAPSCGQSNASAAVAPAHNPTTGHDHAAAPPANQATAHDHSATAPTSTVSDLEPLLAEIDQATGEAKVALMATLLRRLVAERPGQQPALQAGGAGAGQHESMCPMCAAHKASHTPAADGHTGPTAAAAHGAAAGCAMMSQKK